MSAIIERGEQSKSEPQRSAEAGPKLRVVSEADVACDSLVWLVQQGREEALETPLSHEMELDRQFSAEVGYN